MTAAESACRCEYDHHLWATGAASIDQALLLIQTLHVGMSQRNNVLRAFRECIALARTRPATEQSTILNDVRSAIQQHKDASGSEASDQLKALVARVSYLRMTTPHHRLPSRSRLGHSHYVFRDGELVEGKAEAETK